MTTERPFNLTPFTLNLMWLAAQEDSRKARANEKNPHLFTHHTLCAANTMKALVTQAFYFAEEKLYTA